MNHQFKNISLEIWTNSLGNHNIRLDDGLNNEYINVLTTSDQAQAVTLYQDLYNVLKKHLGE